MSDIVERLRKRSDQYPVDALFTEAAAEIERLRSEVDHLADQCSTLLRENRAHKAENAKLRAFLIDVTRDPLNAKYELACELLKSITPKG